MRAADGDRLTQLLALERLGALAGLDLDDRGNDLAAMGAEEARHRLAPGVGAGPALPGRAENG
jgi:hypothetical protein